MATFGLKVVGGPGKPGLLSEVFKGAFGDPELKAKLALTSSQIWRNEYANRLDQQQAEVQRQLGIKTAQEAADLQARHDALARAADPYGEELASKVHDPNAPIPVQPNVLGGNRGGGNLLPPGTLENRPAIVDDLTAAKYKRDLAEAEIERRSQRALGPAIVWSAKDANDLALGSGRGSGNAIILGGGTPDEIRKAMLLQGQIPTTTTVTSSQDTAGVDMAARQKILEDQAAASLHPFGTTEGGSAREVAARLRAKKQAVGLTPLEEQQLAQADAGSLIKQGKGDTLLSPTPNGLVPATGGTINPTTGRPFADTTGVPGVWQDVIDQVVELYSTGQPIPEHLVRLYPRAVFELQGPKNDVRPDANGLPQQVTIPANIDPSLPTPEQVKAAAAGGAQPPPVTPVTPRAASPAGQAGAGGVGGDAGARLAALPASPATPPVTPVTPTTPPVTPLTPADIPAGRPAVDPLNPQIGEVGYPKAVWRKNPVFTEAENRMYAILPSLIEDTAILNPVTSADLPNFAQNLVGGPSPTGLLPKAATALGQAIFMNPKQRMIDQAKTDFAQMRAYLLSGASQAERELANALAGTVPEYNDDDAALLKKTQRRVDLTRQIARVIIQRDPSQRPVLEELARKQGLDLFGDGGGAPAAVAPAAAAVPTDAPLPMPRSYGTTAADQAEWDATPRAKQLEFRTQFPETAQ